MNTTKAWGNVGSLRDFFLLLTVTLLLTTTSFQEAQGHARLLETDPPANTRISEQPTRILLSFSERVEPIFNSITVLDSRGTRVDRESVTIGSGGNTVEVPLNQMLPGPYVVRWRVNSIDGHQIQGEFGFGVQSDPPSRESIRKAGSSEGPSFLQLLWSPLLRWGQFTTLLFWLGGIGFLYLIWGPATHGSGALLGTEGPHPQPIWSLRLAQISSLGFLLFAFAGLLNQSAVLANVPLFQLRGAAIQSTLLESSFGFWWLLRIGSALGLGLLLLVVTRNPRRKFLWRENPTVAVLFGALSVIMLGTISMSGHAGGLGHPAAIVSDWLHLIAITLWVGGLVHLTLLTRSRMQGHEPGFLTRLAYRFSRLALISVGLIAATGVYSSTLHIPTWGAFLGTAYGRILLIKLAFVIAMLSMAGINRQRVLPALAEAKATTDPAGPWKARFRKLVLGEAALGVGVLGLAAWMSSVAPAAAVASTGPFQTEQSRQNTTVKVTIDPARVGSNQVYVQLEDSSGRRILDAKRVTVYYRSQDRATGLESEAMESLGDGDYQCSIFLQAVGLWLISIEVHPSRGDPFVAEFNLSLYL